MNRFSHQFHFILPLQSHSSIRAAVKPNAQGGFRGKQSHHGRMQVQKVLLPYVLGHSPSGYGKGILKGWM